MRDRTLGAAFLASLGLHAALLYLTVKEPPGRTQPPEAMVVHLAEVAAPPEAKPAASAAKPRAALKRAAVRPPATQDEFRLELIERARGEMRHAKLSPAEAWRGDVLVAVLVAPNGRASVSLKESSGHALIDRHGVEAFARAARSLAVPPALRGRSFELELRASYGRED